MGQSIIIPTSGIAVDGSCLPCRTHKQDGYFHGRCEHRVVDICTGVELLRSPIFQAGTINLSEFLAIADAMRLLHEQQDFSAPIYSDSSIAISWCRMGTYKTSLPMNERTRDILDAAKQAMKWMIEVNPPNRVLKWETKLWGEIPADFGRK